MFDIILVGNNIFEKSIKKKDFLRLYVKSIEKKKVIYYFKPKILTMWNSLRIIVSNLWQPFFVTWNIWKL
jgi:hypothetical protein